MIFENPSNPIHSTQNDEVRRVQHCQDLTLKSSGRKDTDPPCPSNIAPRNILIGEVGSYYCLSLFSSVLCSFPLSLYLLGFSLSSIASPGLKKELNTNFLKYSGYHHSVQ